MQKQTILVGLTGQTGAGKTLVSSLLKEKGYPIIDADFVARRVVEPGKKCILDLACEFGITIINEDGSLNRKKLGSIVFADKQKRILMGKIMFPYIQQEIFDIVETYHKKGEITVFLDAPTLFESGTNSRCDKIVSVIAPKKMRLERILQRDQITGEEASLRMSAQHEDDFYTSRSDFVIENSGEISDLRIKVLELLDHLNPDSKPGEVSQ